MMTSPEMVEVAQDKPLIRTYITSLYECNYGEFFKALGMQALLGRLQTLCWSRNCL